MIKKVYWYDGIKKKKVFLIVVGFLNPVCTIYEDTLQEINSI